jgi:DNA-binding CsgD family transcriptional regulator
MTSLVNSIEALDVPRERLSERVLQDQAAIEFTMDRSFIGANQAGFAELSSRNIFSLINGKIIATNPSDDQIIEQLIARKQSATLLVFSGHTHNFVALHFIIGPDLTLCIMRRTGDGSPSLNLEIGALNGLTTAERRVLGLILENMSIDEIALKIGNAVQTVRTHRKHIYAKLGVQGRVELLTKINQALL